MLGTSYASFAHLLSLNLFRHILYGGLGFWGWDLESTEIIKSQDIKNLSTAIGVIPGNNDLSSL